MLSLLNLDMRPATQSRPAAAWLHLSCAPATLFCPRPRSACRDIEPPTSFSVGGPAAIQSAA